MRCTIQSFFALFSCFPPSSTPAAHLVAGVCLFVDLLAESYSCDDDDGCIFSLTFFFSFLFLLSQAMVSHLRLMVSHPSSPMASHRHLVQEVQDIPLCSTQVTKLPQQSKEDTGTTTVTVTSQKEGEGEGEGTPGQTVTRTPPMTTGKSRGISIFISFSSLLSLLFRFS